MRPAQSTIPAVELAPAPNLRELQRYLGRIGDRWPLQLVMLGGARIAGMRRAPGERPAPPRPGSEYVIVLVSDGFDGMPWLERVRQAGSLWDGLEMGEAAEFHCYTAAEYLRRRETTPAVRAVVEHGLLLFADSEPFTAVAR